MNQQINSSPREPHQVGIAALKAVSKEGTMATLTLLKTNCTAFPGNYVKGTNIHLEV